MAKLNTAVRQQQIIDAALELIRDGGMTNLTIKKLASRVHISEQAIYRHFENKLDILNALIHNFNQTLSERLQKQTDSDDLFQTIHSTIYTHLQYFSDYPEMAALVYTEEVFKAEPLIFKQIQETIAMRIQTIAKMIDQGQKDSIISNAYSADNLALIIFGAIRILIANWRFSGFSFNLVARGQSLTNDLLQMIKQ